jgi:FkbM family methyltransferase
MNIKQFCKQFVRNQFEARGLDIVRRLADNGAALPLLRLLIERSIDLDGKGTIIQIGANDGIMADPIHEIVSSLSLPAILVEPLPDIFVRLRENYRNQPNINFENVAIGATPGEAKIYRISAAASHLPDWTRGIASFDRSVLVKHSKILGENIERYIETVLVSVITVKELMRRYLGTQITALQIDTEGHDFVVVKSAVDARLLPRIINYETKHLSFDDQAKCREMLTQHGYSFLSNHQDTLAYRMI